MDINVFNELSKSITFGLELIDAEKAAKYLAHNNGNRGKKKRALHDYAEDMKNGMWKFNGVDNIVFDTNGDLRNGQHRLEAIVTSGEPQAYFVVRGIDPEAFDTMDVGAKRGLADMLHAKDISNETRMAAMVTTYYQMHTGHIGSMAAGSSVGCGTMQERIKFVMANNDSMQAIGNLSATYYKRNHSFFSLGDLSGIIYYLIQDMKFPTEYVEKFLYAVYCGCDQKFDYINKMREKWVMATDPRFKVSTTEKFYSFVKAFNAYFTGQFPKQQWSPKRDRYPDFIDFSKVSVEFENL